MIPFYIRIIIVVAFICVVMGLLLLLNSKDRAAGTLLFIGMGTLFVLSMIGILIV